jgi:PBP1b-binding outer membrane lipoprotein LpoB
MRSIQGSKVLLAALFLAGCAANPAPTEQLARSEAAIAAALDAGAPELATAELESAQAKMKLAQRWIAAKDYKPARWLVEQAQVDAELAAMKAISAKARTASAQATAEFRAFNTQLAALAQRSKADR